MRSMLDPPLTEDYVSRPSPGLRNFSMTGYSIPRALQP